MKATHNPFVYDCGTCGKPVAFNAPTKAWRHISRTSDCLLESVIAVALSFVTKKA